MSHTYTFETVSRIDLEEILSDAGLVLLPSNEWAEEDECVCCDHCSNMSHEDDSDLVTTEDGTQFCDDDCASNGGYTQLEEDGGWHPDEDCCTCEKCGLTYHTDSDEEIITDDDSHYCGEYCAERAGYHRHGDGYWYDYPEGNERGLLPYDSTTVLHRTSSDKPWRIGFEIEKEDAAYDAFDDLPKGWIAVEDGSLDDDYGFELVSPGYNLSEYRTICDHIRYLRNYLSADSTVACGGHISVSESGTSGSDLVERLGDFIPLLYALYPRRLKNEYVAPKNKEPHQSRRRKIFCRKRSKIW